MIETFARSATMPLPSPTFPADTIRVAGAGDAPAVAGLVERYYLAAAATSKERRLARAALDSGVFDTEASIAGGDCFVAEVDGRVVAACAWNWRAGHEGVEATIPGAGGGPPRHFVGSSTAHVRALAVDPGHPPLPLARLLLALCESAAARQGFNGLEAVSLHAARCPYLACGFRALAPLELRCPHGVLVPGRLVRRAIGAARPFPAGPAQARPSRFYRTFTSPL